MRRSQSPTRNGRAKAASLPDVVDASIGAFELIRITARRLQDDVPGLFGAFMMSADAAIDGHEALTVAPSLLLRSGAQPATAVPLDADIGQAADSLARFIGA